MRRWHHPVGFSTGSLWHTGSAQPLHIHFGALTSVVLSFQSGGCPVLWPSQQSCRAKHPILPVLQPLPSWENRSGSDPKICYCWTWLLVQKEETISEQRAGLCEGFNTLLQWPPVEQSRHLGALHWGTDTFPKARGPSHPAWLCQRLPHLSLLFSGKMWIPFYPNELSPSEQTSLISVSEPQAAQCVRGQSQRLPSAVQLPNLVLCMMVLINAISVLISWVFHLQGDDVFVEHAMHFV